VIYINGQWRNGTGSQFQSLNPANEQVLWTGCSASANDIDDAVASAQRALPDWKGRSLDERLFFLKTFQQQLEQNLPRLAKLITEEVGKPLWDATTEVQGMIGKIDLTIQAFHSRRASTEIEISGGVARTRYQPLGVVAVYGPFNFPGHIANGQIAPALLAGNTLIFKPSELTPLVAEETVKLWEETGLPPGVLNLVQGARDTGEAIAQHSGIQAILFTGSLKTGVALQRALVGRPEVLLALELGGNNPLVVHRISDIDAAVYWTIQSAYITSGQRCTCARRLIVTKGNDEFLKRLQQAVSQLTPDRPDANPPPFLGPLVHASAVERLLQEQQRLVDHGARVLVQAQRSSLGGAFVSPGLMDVTSCSSLTDEEVFGPLLQVHRVQSFDEAITVANDTQYGLVAGLFSDQEEDFREFANSVQAGLINWNRPTTGASGQLPFGGWGKSGNHRPAGYFMIDSCNSPVAMMESPSLSMPESSSPGLERFNQ